MIIVLCTKRPTSVITQRITYRDDISYICLHHCFIVTYHTDENTINIQTEHV